MLGFVSQGAIYLLAVNDVTLAKPGTDNWLAHPTPDQRPVNCLYILLSLAFRLGCLERLFCGFDHVT